MRDGEIYSAVSKALACKAHDAEIARLTEALSQIIALEREPFAFPADWHQQIDACAECRRYKDHPIQQGICDTHRRPLWDREAHESDEQKRLIYRAKNIAQAALAFQSGTHTPRDQA